MINRIKYRLMLTLKVGYYGHLLESSHVLMEKFFKKGAKEESSPVENKKWKWGNSKK